VPNLCLAKWDVHNILRVFIPGLYNRHTRSPFLSQEDHTTFYEQGLLLAVKELCGDRAAEWPATYTDEMYRARGRNGTLSFQTKMIPDWKVGDLGTTIRSKLGDAGIPWARGIVFLHQIRGVKDSTIHSVDDVSAEQAFTEFLRNEHLDENAILTGGSWWIDVGIQVTSTTQNCLAWRTDSHGQIVQQIFDIDLQNAVRMTSIGSSQYTRDMTSHLPQVSGCRIEPGVRGRGPFEVTYLQLYTTDKCVTYRQDQGHYSKYITCGDIIKGKASVFINGLYTAYRNAIDNNYSQARMEVRVPIHFATEVLLELDGNIICQGLVSFSPMEWWYVLFIVLSIYVDNSIKEFTCLPCKGDSTCARKASRGTLGTASKDVSTCPYCRMCLAAQWASFSSGQ
jgi:hypothetical protein